MTEQFYFEMQLFEFAWAWVLCAAAVGLSYFGILRKQLWASLTAILCMIWSFSSYQTYPVQYITLTVACFVLLYRRWTLEENRSGCWYFSLIFSLVGHFAMGFILNTVITNLYFSSSNYLNGRVAWGILPVKQIVKNILRHIADGVLGNGIFYTLFFGLLAAASVICALWDVCKRKEAKYKWLYVLAIMGLQACPFLMTIYVGTVQSIRTQMVYPMVIACDILYLLSRNRDLRRIGQHLMRLAVTIAAIATVGTQTQTTLRLIYTDTIRAAEDMELLNRISQEIDAVGGNLKPVAFVGVYQNKLNNACLRGEMIGATIFNWDRSIGYTASTRRICEGANVLGLEWSVVSEEQMQEAQNLAYAMPVWPSPGSVMDAGDFVVIRLSDSF